MSYELTWEDRGVYKHFTGHVSFAEFSRSQGEALGNVRTDDIDYIINDVLDITGYSVTSGEAEEAGSMGIGASQSNPRLCVAFITTDLKLIALIKLASLVTSVEIKAFATCQAARSWIAGRRR